MSIRLGLLTLVVASIAGLSTLKAIAQRGVPEGSPRVPLVALVANPERYDGTEIEVMAWGAIEFEGAALYLSPSDHKYLVAEAGVWLEVSEEPRFPTNARGYLAVQGRFLSGDKARGFAGRITDIKKLNILSETKS